MYDALLRVLDWIDSTSATAFLLAWVVVSIVAGFGFNYYVERGQKGVKGLDGERYR